jgi:hypothetical protein
MEQQEKKMPLSLRAFYPPADNTLWPDKINPTSRTFTDLIKNGIYFNTTEALAKVSVIPERLYRGYGFSGSYNQIPDQKRFGNDSF